ncbi:MAG: glutaredoxin family protein [Planctomycetes bacterium]|nr:glutaredoxin family protein [Planctomycetota bacterium]
MLKEFLSAKGIEFESKDILQDPTTMDELINKTGARSVPVVIIDDKDIVIGFDRGKISKLLGIK